MKKIFMFFVIFVSINYVNAQTITSQTTRSVTVDFGGGIIRKFKPFLYPAPNTEFPYGNDGMVPGVPAPTAVIIGNPYKFDKDRGTIFSTGFTAEKASAFIVEGTFHPTQNTASPGYWTFEVLKTSILWAGPPPSADANYPSNALSDEQSYHLLGSRYVFN